MGNKIQRKDVFSTSNIFAVCAVRFSADCFFAECFIADEPKNVPKNICSVIISTHYAVYSTSIKKHRKHKF